MATIIQSRRGTTAEHAVFTGAVGEITVDTTKDTAVVHDNFTTGGHPLAKEAGNSSQVFSVGTPTAAAHAMRADLSYVAQDFRLSLTTAMPVTTADVTGATTVYAVPYMGNRIGLYDGTIWKNYTSAEISVALGTITNDNGYDVFCYQNSGTPTLELLAWTNGSTRATALAYSNGILVKSGDATRRYMGSFLTTSTTTTEDGPRRNLFNYDYPVDRPVSVIDTTNSWTYTTATFRQANGSTANQSNFFIGVVEHMIEADVYGRFSNGGTTGYCSVGIGLNSTSVNSAQVMVPGNSYSGGYALTHAHFKGYPTLGKNYLAWLEQSVALGTSTWYGDEGGASSTLQLGMVGRIKL